MPRSQRVLAKSLPFGDVSFADLDIEIPLPTGGESLFDVVKGDEEHVYPYFEWLQSPAELLEAFAWQYHQCAVGIVKSALARSDRPDNVAYVVGFLYRHSMELSLKAIIVRTARYQSLTAKEQRKLLKDHSLERLWKRAREVVQEYMPDDGLKTFEEQLIQLHNFDANSDGFRYPFTFQKDGTKSIAVKQISYASFENFVWILEGLYTWIESTRDFERDWLEAMAAQSIDVPLSERTL